jgi:hypothetical protein
VLERAGGTPVEGIVLQARRRCEETDAAGAVGARARRTSRASSRRAAGRGAYAIEGLDNAEYLVTTVARGEYPSARRLFRAGTESADIVLDSARSFELHGVVASKDGEPLDDAEVKVAGQDDAKARSDAQGRYSLEVEVLEDQVFHVISASREGYRATRTNVRMDDVKDARDLGAGPRTRSAGSPRAGARHRSRPGRESRAGRP